jgi:hypothetical protein
MEVLAVSLIVAGIILVVWGLIFYCRGSADGWHEKNHSSKA